ncbi:MAG: TetR/AcrR family transcriptional regulator [Gammaproteobacteria bacterium]|nr:TetR/AcrR family transcriptional regulator [Gammaproteobacteria bacterium]MDH5628763.1 TetR/AcrR family transcriptional regulator [Gammaproteobacteria bacterium]
MKDQKEIIRETNEKKIIQAAEQVFARFGFKGATTEMIARKAGLPKSNLHYYFKTKLQLYRVVLERILIEWMDAAEVFDQYQDPKTALTHYVEAKMQFSRNRPLASKVWANEILHGATVAGDFLRTEFKNWFEDKKQIVENWVQEGRIKPVDPYVLFYMIWSVTQHYADFENQIEILNNDEPYNEDEYQQKTDDVVNMILTSVRV